MGSDRCRFYAMTNDRPKLGPWLRSYEKRQRTGWREWGQRILIGFIAVVVFAAALFGVLWFFLRYPLQTFGALLAIWLVGFVISLILRARARARRARGEAPAFWKR